MITALPLPLLTVAWKNVTPQIKSDVRNCSNITLENKLSTRFRNNKICWWCNTHFFSWFSGYSILSSDVWVFSANSRICSWQHMWFISDIMRQSWMRMIRPFHDTEIAKVKSSIYELSERKEMYCSKYSYHFTVLIVSSAPVSVTD